ncbi:MAG: acetyl-CoA carboxylase biotin carboxylase subunit [Candidatus Saganbacteria bacterium]|nr:acetyl-CoA carboxylase biotin carboxylase subunit [Candidatus Saganbacteria bacterium]
MFEKILVANRGEIAIRVIRACREMGIKSVAVYSEADKDSLHARLADESYCIGPAVPASSYLNIPRIISTAEVCGAQAIHPGYGFLAENAKFAEICAAHNIVFIGPSPSSIESMGDKATAKQCAMRSGVPTVPGSEGIIKDPNEALRIAKKIGFPVVIKATAGGGGRGMRVVKAEADFLALMSTAQTEAGAAFGNSDIYVEKFIEQPKHVEIQILADAFGNVVYLGERDCSVQRRHQKLVEESPCAVLNEKTRKKMGEAAVRLAKAVKYCSAGTVEYLLDKNGNYYFMEMNTRVQVEHPVTEMVTSVDILKEQISIAALEKMRLRQSDIKIRGHAIELRINAEDPDKNFMPSPGQIKEYIIPGGPGVRIDSLAYAGCRILPNYDSLIAKLIVWAPSRDEAIARAKRCLDEFIITGIKTTIPFHKKVMDNEAFKRGEVYTDFISANLEP